MQFIGGGRSEEPLAEKAAAAGWDLRNNSRIYQTKISFKSTAG